MIEALVALAVTAAALAAIGQLGFSSLAAVRRTQARLDLVAAARAALASLPGRSATLDGVTSGALFRDRYSLGAAPFAAVPSGGPAPSGWTPQRLDIAVADPSGASLVISTVRLRRSGP